MARFPFFRRTFRITRFRADASRDVSDEIEVYLEMRTQELVEQGMAPEEARRAAVAAFGDRRRIEDECRRIAGPLGRRRRRAEIVGSFFGDLRLALRDMRKRPADAALACLTLAICMAVNGAVFSVVRAIVLRPLPFPDPDRIVTVFNAYPNTGSPRDANSASDYFDRRERVAAFAEVALYQSRTHTLGEPGAIRRAFSMAVTPSFLPLLGVEPFLGRNFTEEETEPGKSAKALIGYRLWQDYFGGDASILGRKVTIEGDTYEVVGVLPRDFLFPGWDAELWLPVTLTEWLKSDEARHRANYFDMLARLEPGATVELAERQLDALNRTLVDRVPARFRQTLIDSGYTTVVRPFHADLVRGVRQPLLLLWAGALFVLLIGAVTLTNLLLVRSTGRLRELATRYVLGAGRGRLLRQLLTESLALAVVGGGFGLLAAHWSLRLVNVFEAYQVPRVGEIRVDATGAGLVLLLAVAVMAGSGAVSALALRRENVFSVLRAGTSTVGTANLRLRGALVATQVAVAFILTAGAGLTLSSLRNLNAVDPGFEPEGVLAGALKLPPAWYPDAGSQHGFLAAVLGEIRRLPGVVDAAVASQLPFSGMAVAGPLTPEGYTREPGESVIGYTRTSVSPAYFSVMGIPLLEGRTFTEKDDEDGHPVMIVSERVARRYWGAAGALGRRVYPGVEPDADAEWHTVVGVVGEVLQTDLIDQDSDGAFYLPYRQSGMGFSRLAVKTAQEPYALLPAIRERIFSIDPQMPVFWVETLEESVAGTLIPFRVPMQLLLVFAAVALVLAAVGVYGVLAQSVAQRRREIGIRMALGSPRSGIYRWTLASMMVFVAAGLALGVGGALALTRLMKSLLYGVHPGDPTVFGIVVAVSGGAAFLASLVPARQAMTIDPVKALDAD